MTYRVSRSGSNYELQSEENPYLHYIHNAPQSASVANIQQLTTLQSQNYYNHGSEDIHTVQQQTAVANSHSADLHKFSQNADRFTTSVSFFFQMYRPLEPIVHSSEIRGLCLMK